MTSSAPPNLIKEIHIATKSGMPDALILPCRGSNESGGRVSVICGRNNSGKSHLMRQVFGSIVDHNKNLALPAEKQIPIGLRTPELRSVSVMLDRPLEVCSSIYSFETYHQVVNKTRVPFDADLAKKNYVERPILRACLKAACRMFPGLASLNHLSELPPPQERLSLAKSFFKDNVMYRLPVTGTLLEDFERMAGGCLYVRCSFRKEHPATLFALRYHERLHVDYSNWSLGQQVLFCYLCLLEFERPALLFMDEPDHALHPTFMTELLAAAKKTCLQIIVASHHPHLIFSQHADDVWFLENGVEEPLDWPDSEEYRGHYPKTGAPKLPLTVQLSSSDIEKVAHAYRLFDSWDDRLLRLSDLAGIRLTQALAAQMRALLTLEVKTVSKQGHADIQTSNLKELAELSPGGRILDFGAGRGRLWKEWQKIKDRKAADWILWEPSSILREELKCEVRELDDSVHVPDNLDAVDQQSCDCIVLANVLHECTPPQIASILSRCAKLIKPGGRLLVAELHHLLDAERFAVAYSSQDMLELLHGAGWNGYPTALNIRSGTISAYFVASTLRETVEPFAIIEVIEKNWRNIQKRHCATYSGRLNFTKAQSLTGCLSELTEIAAINSYFNGVWK